MKTSELMKKLKKAGCYFVRQGAGSHEIWYSPVSDDYFVVANHGAKEVPKGTESKILKQAAIK
jgi:predicted RNA binding protein YcfA (HicA-like mRNA interferase family)